MVIHRGIFKNNQITLFPCFTCIPETGVSFWCEYRVKLTHEFIRRLGQRPMSKAPMGRRALTPDPDRPVGDYQNLTDMQAVIFGQQPPQQPPQQPLPQTRQRTNDCVDGVVLNHPRFNEPIDTLTKNK